MIVSVPIGDELRYSGRHQHNGCGNGRSGMSFHLQKIAR
jgi:hypothetical protein